jgi:hypothetical protein
MKSHQFRVKLKRVVIKEIRLISLILILIMKTKKIKIIIKLKRKILVEIKKKIKPKIIRYIIYKKNEILIYFYFIYL